MARQGKLVTWFGNPVCGTCGWVSMLNTNLAKLDDPHHCPGDGIHQLMDRVESLGRRVMDLELKNDDRCCRVDGRDRDHAVCSNPRARSGTFCTYHEERRANSASSSDRKARMRRRFGKEED